MAIFAPLHVKRPVSDVQDLRLLIIDNASTDDSVAIARQLASEDKRISGRLASC
jgi:glycosyltransferase involved in cell wall biosynthesis